MTSEFNLRRASTDDAVLLSVLATTAFYEAYFEQDMPHNLARYIAESFAVEKLRDELSSRTETFFLLFRHDRAVGYAKMRRETHADGVPAQGSIELQRLYLVERAYGTGAAKLLLDECFNYALCEGFKSVWLGVWEENPRARRFYEKYGFRRVGQLEFPYGDVVGINHVMLCEVDAKS